MVPAQNAKWLIVTPPVAAVNNASVLTTAIDTLGFDYAEIVMVLGVSSASDISALKVQESDYANMSGAADITGLIYGTSTDIGGSTSALPLNTNDNTAWGFEISLKARKRYLDVVATVDASGTGCFVTGVARLSRAEQAPTTKTTKGLTGCLRV